MAAIEIPEIKFPQWRRWANRERPSQDFDVPVGFGLFGIYMLATSEVDAGLSPEADRYLDEAVIYIGMSGHVEQRLERSHDAVKAYTAVWRSCGRQPSIYDLAFRRDQGTIRAKRSRRRRGDDSSI